MVHETFEAIIINIYANQPNMSKKTYSSLTQQMELKIVDLLIRKPNCLLIAAGLILDIDKNIRTNNSIKAFQTIRRLTILNPNIKKTIVKCFLDTNNNLIVGK